MLTADKKLAETYYKSCGIDLGLYDTTTKKMRKDAITHPTYQQNLQTIRQYLEDGWTASELDEKIWELYRGGYRSALLHTLIPRKKGKLNEDSNLIEPGVVYQHPTLYNLRMPMYAVGPSGMSELSGGDKILKESYTLRDLMMYFCNASNTPQIPARVSGVFNYLRYLLTTARVDEVLVAIDLAVLEHGPLTPIVKVSDHLTAAQDQVELRSGRANEGVPRV